MNELTSLLLGYALAGPIFFIIVTIIRKFWKF